MSARGRKPKTHPRQAEAFPERAVGTLLVQHEGLHEVISPRGDNATASLQLRAPTGC